MARKLYGSIYRAESSIRCKSFLPTRTQVKEAIDTTPYDTAPRRQVTSGFRSALEELHNGPHNWVGGVMAGAGSPEDPVFGCIIAILIVFGLYGKENILMNLIYQLVVQQVQMNWD